MNFGNRLREWLKQVYHDLADIPYISNFRREWAETNRYLDDLYNQRVREGGVLKPHGTPAIVIALILFVAAIISWFVTSFTDSVMSALGIKRFDTGSFLRDQMRQLGRSKDMRDFQKEMGDMLMDLVITPLELSLDDPDVTPRDFASQFHGSLASLTLAGHTAGLIAEATSVGAIKEVGNLFRDLYFNFGLGFMGWQTLSPLLDIGVKETGARYYNKRYRPKRWLARELMDLYALDQISADLFNSEMQIQGYRDADIALALKLSQTQINVSDVLQALDLGIIDENTAVIKIRQRGYAPDDAAFLVRLQNEQKRQNDLDAIVSVARTAFRAGIIPENQLRDILRSAKYTDDRVNLEIAVGKLSQETALRDLSVGQIESAFKDNAISEQEARHYLELAKIEPASQSVLIESWKIEKSPSPRRLNASTITDAYRAGVIDRAKASGLLQGVGWTSSDASLILDTEDVHARPPVRRLSLGMIESAFKSGIVDETKARALLANIQFDKASEDLVIATWQDELKVTPVPLSPKIVSDAYLAEILTRAEALAKLVGAGRTPADAEIILRLADREKDKSPKAVSESRIVSAFTNGIVELDAATKKLTDLGFSTGDADFILRSATISPKRKVRELSDAVVIDLFGAGQITRDNAIARLSASGYDPSDAELLLDTRSKDNTKPLGEAVVLTLYDNDIFSETETLDRLQLLNYSRADAGWVLVARAVKRTPSA